ncbi:LpxI family protein [Roseomonas sp. M0104]|uniref:LpxI family protein n=1 Tax=Teichococcus coralli TaxID=2545983 RepID=A0A845BAU5_9PROT|nr:UDP-2,3-diacylglucosamine diphosphatase LpxI [Pseudoroseomonas coralli]MXP63226.1 LpxI family protein [Pseudoroseomonas coralli]
MGAPLGMIVGGGLLPQRAAAAAAAAGRMPHVVILEGFGNPADYAGYPHIVCRLGAGGQMLEWLRGSGARDLVLAGRVTRPSFFALRPDAGAARLLPRIGVKAFGGDDSLLQAVLGVLREEGFNPMPAQDVMRELLVAEPAALTSLLPDEAARQDIRRGIAVVRALGAADIGQCTVVQQGLVLAVEAIEGTDAMLARAGSLRREGPGGVLVKILKPGQDRRVDLPTIGPDTVAGAAAAGLRGIAIEANGTIVVDRAATVAAAEAAGLFLIALDPAALVWSEPHS